MIGVVLRTKDDTSPVFVSIGHRVSLNTAIELILDMSITRIPEPTKIADSEVKKYINKIRNSTLTQDCMLFLKFPIFLLKILSALLRS